MSQMLRTQIYLPRDLYDKLHQRTERDGISMAEQIRTAVRKYLSDAQQGEDVFGRDDSLWSIVGIAEGPPDASTGHDKYIYGWDHNSRDHDGRDHDGRDNARR